MGWDSPVVDSSSRALAASAEKLEREYAEWAQRYDAPASRFHVAPPPPGAANGGKAKGGSGDQDSGTPMLSPSSHPNPRGLTLHSSALRDDGQFRVSVSSLDSEEEDFNKFCERVAATISTGGGAARVHGLDDPVTDFHETITKGDDSDVKGSGSSVEVRVLLENAEQQRRQDDGRKTPQKPECKTDRYRKQGIRPRSCATGLLDDSEGVQPPLSTATDRPVNYLPPYTSAEHSSPESVAAVEDYFHSTSPPPQQQSRTELRSLPGGEAEEEFPLSAATPNSSQPAWETSSDNRWSTAKILSGRDRDSKAGSPPEDYDGDRFEFHSSGDGRGGAEQEIYGSSGSRRGSGGGGWALQSLANEERALEEELAGINAQLMGKPAWGAVQDLANETIAEVDSVLGGTAAPSSSSQAPIKPPSFAPHYREATQGGKPEWWQYTTPSHGMDRGPMEYNPGQARSEEMYVGRDPISRDFTASGLSASPPRSRRTRSPSPTHSHPTPHNRHGEVDVAGLNVSSGRLSRAGSSGPYEWIDGRPKPAQPGREQLDSRIADRMYRHAVEINNKKEFARRTATQEAEEAALQGCTFKPSINRRSAELAKTAPRYRGQRAESEIHRELDNHYRHVHCTGNPCGPDCPEVGAQRFTDRRGRATSAPRERGGSKLVPPSAKGAKNPPPVRRGPTNTVHSRGWEAYDFQQPGTGNEISVQFRGFDAARGTPDYEAELAASVEAARRAMKAGRGVEGMSSPRAPVGRETKSYVYAEAKDEWGEEEEGCVQLREDDVAVTRACHRLYQQGLAQKEKLQEKRRRAREQEQTLAKTALEGIKSRAASPGPRLAGSGRQGSPYRSPRGASYKSPERSPRGASYRSPERAPRVSQRQQQQHSRPNSAPHHRPAWIPGNGKKRDAQGAISSTQRMHSPTRSRSPNKAESFGDFLQRQSEFVNKKEAKVKAAMQAAAKKPAPPVSEGSRKILRQQQATAKIIQEEIDALVGGYDGESIPGVTEVNYMADTTSSAQRSPAPKMSASTMSFMQRLELAMQGGGQAQASGRLGLSTTHAAPLPEQRLNPQRREITSAMLNPECTFKPKITRQAAVRKARSPAEMSEGDRRRREAWREEQVRERKERELDGVTFSPRTGVTGHYSDVQSRLCLGRPDVYMEYLEHRTQTQEARAAVHRARRTEEEVAECTFAPQVSPRAPSYVERLARGHAARAAAGLSASAESGPEFSWR